MINFLVKNKRILFLLIILIFATLTRLWMLGEVPISMSDDEIREVYSAYSIYQTRNDIFKNFLPLVIKMDGFTFGPLTIYFSSLFFIFFDLTSFSGRLPYAIAGILSIIVLFSITKELTKSATIAFLSALAMTFSAWHLQVSRVAHDAGMALLFYLIAIYFFIKIKKHKNALTVISSLFLVIAFYCYVATRVVFVPVIMALIWYKYKDLTKRQLFIIIIFAITALSTFGILSLTNKAAQYVGGQFFFQNTERTGLEVELERRASNSPKLLKEVFHNKFTYLFNVFSERYVNIFSPQFLFTNGENNRINSLPDRGELYPIEAPLIVLGALYLFVKKRREFILILAFLLIAPLPSGLGGMNITYVTRSIFFIPWIYLLVGAGFYSIHLFLKDNKTLIILYFLISVMYIYSVGGYFIQYYYDYVYQGAKYFSKGTQDLVIFINKQKNNYSNVIIADATPNIFLHYAFYSKLSPTVVQSALESSQGRIKLEKIIFDYKCINNGLGDPRDFMEKKSIYIAPINCHKSTKFDYSIKSYDNTEDVWMIYIK